MVKPPNIDYLVKEANRIQEIEDKGSEIDFDMLSELSQSRVQDKTKIPEQLELGNIAVAAVKRYITTSEHVNELISEQFSTLKTHEAAQYFVEV